MADMPLLSEVSRLPAFGGEATRGEQRAPRRIIQNGAKRHFG